VARSDLPRQPYAADVALQELRRAGKAARNQWLGGSRHEETVRHTRTPIASHEKPVPVQGSAIGQNLASGIARECCRGRAIWRLHEMNLSHITLSSAESRLLAKQNAGCRSWESSSGIAVDVQQRLNCALPVAFFESSGFFRSQSLHGISADDQLIHLRV